jgi:hypothetical protein
VRRQLLYLVKKSFTDGQTARDSLALAEQNLTSLDEVERIQRVRAEKGDISELELLRIQVQRFAFERTPPMHGRRSAPPRSRSERDGRRPRRRGLRDRR